ncbi:MAG: DUF502 domain-containing protein [Planctomycetes bacterium]|nr:DUF502 domain-containing protein [Planctomycetota bacterium]
MAGNIFRRHLITGLAALLPTLLTVFVFFKLWEFARDTIGNPLVYALTNYKAGEAPSPPSWLTFAGGAAAFVLLILLAMLLGLILTSFIGARIFRAVENSLQRLPFISAIYRPVRQVTDFFLSDKTQQFRSVVAVEYPRKGMYSMGFVTSSGLKDVTTPDGRRMISVFVPSSPTPFTGYVVLVAESEIIPLPVAIDEAIRFSVSAGVIRPKSEIPEIETSELSTATHDAGV